MALNFHEWLLTESVRLHEQQHGRRRDDETANAVARSTHGAMTDQLAARASTLPLASGAAADVRRLQLGAAGAVSLVIIGAAFAGMLVARSTLQPEGIDTQTAQLALVGLPTLALLGWLAATTVRRLRGLNGGLAGAVARIALESLGPRWLRGDLAADVTRAGVYLLRTRGGQACLAAAVHATWLAYTGAAVATLLSAGSGLAPTTQVSLYAALPRLLLMLGYTAVAGYHSQRMTLDVTLPGYLQLRDRVHAGSVPANQSEAPMATLPRAPRQADETASGPVRVFAAERTADDLQAAVPDLDAAVLGSVDTRSERRALASVLRERPHPPPGLLATCSVLRTPDTGTAQILGDMAETAGAPLILVLHDRLALLERGGDPDARIADWHRLADSIGADCVVFDHHQPDPAAIASIRQWTHDAEAS
ncbi:hypothetical protein BA899_07390 [Spiribacter sp. SSL99]|uniref:DUF2868 domain-containing protein n=1 Tax=Spiribacter sp. SSL99 TaxID=1866884 RepID=UPI00132F83AF|nr:DUF2868 domain-containing protein [Spiribacter sp. SSL99]KAF0284926.1 hypothetical protein BA899_07390 [Spiribacter sp. SSL99]